MGIAGAAVYSLVMMGARELVRAIRWAPRGSPDGGAPYGANSLRMHHQAATRDIKRRGPKGGVR